jgi:hypothetical protein
MKKTVIALAAFMAATTAAEAACSKSSLNGNWVVFIVSASSGQQVTMSGGQFNLGAAVFKIDSFGKNCLGSGTATSGATTYATVVASDGVSPSSSAKPNLLEISALLGPIVQTYQLFRQ